MNRIGVIIRCEHSHFIQVVMNEQEAYQFILSWKENKLAEKATGKCLATGSVWIVQTSKIILIHTAELGVTGGLPQGQPQYPGYGSGYIPKQR